MSTEVLTDILSPPVRRCLADEVVVRLRQGILSGHFAPGEQLRESVLAQSMNISRGPVREALNQLEREGLVLMRPNRVAVVARLSRADFEEVYTLRLALECLAIRLATRNASETELVEMQAILDLLEADVADGTTQQAMADLDLRFHDLIYQCSRHHRLQNVWAALRSQVYILLLCRNAAARDFAEQALEGHREILSAVRSGDEARAVTIIQRHLQSMYDRVLPSYQ